MIQITPQMRILVAVEPVDGRKEQRFAYWSMTNVQCSVMCSLSHMSRNGGRFVVIDCTLPRLQRVSSHSRTVWFLRQAALREPGKGFTRAMASRFMSRSIVAYRFVVLGLACPSHWLMVDRSTPDFSRATAALCRML